MLSIYLEADKCQRRHIAFCTCDFGAKMHNEKGKHKQVDKEVTLQSRNHYST